MLRIQGLTHTYRLPNGTTVDALRGIDLTVADGERIALVGANGSGKSTLARHLNALLLPTSGDVWVNGINTRDESQLKTLRGTVGLVFQDPDNQLVATVVDEDVAFGPENLGVNQPELGERVDRALAAVDMAAHRKRPPHLLSGGQRQRVAIAGILAMRPRVLALDEATAMLDPHGRCEILDIVDRLHRAGTTIIQVTHFMHEAALADRVVVLAEGRVLADGTPKEVFAQPAVLRQAGLELPKAAQLSAALQAADPSLPLALTPSALAEELVARLGGDHRPPTTDHVDDRGPRTKDQGDQPSVSHLIGPSSFVLRQPVGSVIAVRDLGHVYLKGTPFESMALRGATLAVAPGEILGVVGATGSGKSTLLQHLNGLLRPQSGDVVVLGHDLADANANVRQVRRQVGLVFQNPEDQLFEQYIGDDIAFGPRNLGLDREAVRQRVRDAMTLVDLDFDAFKDRLTFALSGGQRRRVALAGVLAMQPQVLILDEPTAGLDPATRADLLAKLVRLNRDHGLTLIVATHNMDDLAEIADRIVVLAGGETVLDGPTRAVFSQAETLTALHLGLPQATQVMLDLRARGYDVPTDVLTVAEAAAILTPMLQQETAHERV